MYQNHPKADEKKRKLMADIGSTEPYLESWPSVLIMTIIFAYANGLSIDSPNGIKNAQAVFGEDDKDVS